MIRAESIGWTGCPWYHHTRFCRCSNAKSIALLQWRRGVPNRNTLPTFSRVNWWHWYAWTDRPRIEALKGWET